jgi:hypothetical protein
MTPQTRIAEASLLFAAPLSRDVASETPELTRCLDSLGWPVETTQSVAGEVLVLNCGAVQITVAQSALPFELADFRGVARPGPDHARDAQALARLQAHQACVTVLIADSRSARRPAHAAAKRRICWEVTDLIAEALGAELVFWGETDMLYFADEFAQASLAEAPTPAEDATWRCEAQPGHARPKDPQAPDLPFADDGPGLDFLHPLHEDRAGRPDLARRVAAAPAGEVFEAEAYTAEMSGAAVDRRNTRDLASVLTLALIGLGLASLSVLNGLVPIQ